MSKSRGGPCVSPHRPYPRLCAPIYRRGFGRASSIAVGLAFRAGVLRLMPSQKGSTMLYTIAVVLVLLWLLGLVTSYTMGGFIHILLVIALVVVLLRVINGRAVV